METKKMFTPIIEDPEEYWARKSPKKKSPTYFKSRYKNFEVLNSMAQTVNTWEITTGYNYTVPTSLIISTPQRPEPNYHIYFPITRDNTPEGIHESDAITIKEYLDNTFHSHILSYQHWPKEAFFTRYANGLKLHRKGGPAIIHRNGDTEYWIRGKRIDHSLIIKLFSDGIDGMTAIELLSYRNIEMRRCLMECLGDDGLARKLKNLLIYIHSDYLNNRLYTLYKTTPIVTPGYRDIELYFVQVKDASTSREYYLQVPPMNDAIEAVAWTFYETKATYHPVIET
jgi:hypothetical protein